MRTEHDSLGSLSVPRNAYYGIHTVRARDNFSGTSYLNDHELIKNYLKVKLACVRANQQAGNWKNKHIPAAISQACQDLLTNFDKYVDEFALPAIQGGAGTSTNMNVNEVIANHAVEILGGKKGDYQLVNPNDDVNKSQSTNDTYPTAGHLTLIQLTGALLQTLEEVIATIERLAFQNSETLKMGRTQLEDAIPTTFGRSFGAYASLLARDLKRLKVSRSELLTIPLGGTAIGTSLTATHDYLTFVIGELRKITLLPVQRCEDLVDGVQNTDEYVHLSNTYKSLAVDLSKICNDLRLLGSGPQDGLGELNLPQRQAGSSIMPGKVNPVIPEFVTQISYQVIGHDTTITMASEAGQLELNAFEPVMFFDLFDDARLLNSALRTLNDHCLKGITVNKKRCRQMVETSAEAATALSPLLGYETVSQLIKEALREQRPIRELVGNRLSGSQLDKALSPKAFFVK
ncbi:aspartate ammonia-lyase [Lactobacillus alvi]|uniref:Aspartate ammonia-lyase n=1 Tax=Limosilactobacillus alvi TaxID=990412 RepID=A0ABS2EPC1_9LACO|nr:aspartate ammonia-lyase [Limosilactobacillus alvi]MBM6754352.1 aspartate ammonia-lyase [Limosilactobacillus alvi]